MLDPSHNVVAASPNCFFGFSPFVAYRYFPRVGITNVEVPAPPDGEGGFAPELLDASGVRRLKDRLTSYGVTPISVGAYCDLLDPRQVDAMRRRIDFAHALGAGIVVSDASLQLEVDANQQRKLVNTLRYLGDYAADLAVRIALEIHGGLTRNGKLARRLLDAVDHPAVGVNYDTGNVYYYNDDVDPAEDIKHVADRVFQVHLKDTLGGKGEWQFCALGEGRVGFPAVVAALQAAQFTGPYSLELEGKATEDLNREGNLRVIEKSMQYLREIGLLPPGE